VTEIRKVKVGNTYPAERRIWVNGKRFQLNLDRNFVQFSHIKGW
jgi:hypothetical protein